MADNVVADVEFEDCVAVLDGFEETAMRFVGGAKNLVVIVREGGVGRFVDIVGAASLSRSLCG